MNLNQPVVVTRQMVLIAFGVVAVGLLILLLVKGIPAAIQYRTYQQRMKVVLQQTTTDKVPPEEAAKDLMRKMIHYNSPRNPDCEGELVSVTIKNMLLDPSNPNHWTMEGTGIIQSPNHVGSLPVLLRVEQTWNVKEKLWHQGGTKTTYHTWKQIEETRGQ